MHTPEKKQTAHAETTLRDRALSLRVRHFLHDVAGRDWFSVSDGSTVQTYWKDGEVVTRGGSDAARLAVVMAERSRVAGAQGF